MVIVKNPKRGRIGPSLRGLFYAYETEEGFKISSWPKKRGKPKSQAQAEAQHLFKDACAGLKRLPAPFLNYAREQAVGTPMLPRDYLMAAGYGRGQTLKLPNGERRYWMATRVDMSMLMDNLGDQEGMLLYRGKNDLWLGLAVGEAGQVLTVGDDFLPAWSDPEGGGGAGWRHSTYGSVSGRAFATKGVYFNPMISGEIDKIAFRHDVDARDVLEFGIYRVTGTTTGTVVEILHQQQYTGVIDGVERTGTIVFEEPVQVAGGARYVFAFSTKGRGGTYPTRLTTSTGFTAAFPVVDSGGYAELASDTVSIGSVFATISGTAYSVFVRGTF